MDVKWIKIGTQMFDDEKIKIIESMPEADLILIVWIKLLVQAGKTNACGYVCLNENIPYTDEMLSALFNRPLNSIRLAISTLEQFGMIRKYDDFILISNWEKHQNVDGMEKIKDQTRRRVARHREKQKQLTSSVTSNVTVTQGNGTDIELELDIDKDILNTFVYDVISYLNLKTGKKFSVKTQSTNKYISGRLREGRTLDDFKHVIDVKTAEWLNDKRMNQYLRPETLFNPTKFEIYLNQQEVKLDADDGGNPKVNYSGVNFGF